LKCVRFAPSARQIIADSLSMDNQHHVACPRCSALNRIPVARISDQPVCGQCKQALFPGKPVILSDQNFAAHVERSSIPVAVDFWAPWCGPCKMMAPHFERVAANVEPGVRLAKLDTDANPVTASRFNIRSIPTVILFRNGREVARQSGAMDANTLSGWIRQHA
jgi:thioredoxin 2